MRKTVVAVIVRYLSRLRFPRLFGLTALLFVADLVFPDVVPLVDELLLGLGAALLGSWKRRREEKRGELEARGEDRLPGASGER